MLDLKSLASESYETAVMAVRHPDTGEDIPGVTITLASMDSERFRKAKNAIVNRRLSDMTGRRMTAERAEEETLDGLAAITVKWTGIVYDGAEQPCDTDHVKAVYRKVPWLREQVDMFVGQRANFLKPSKPE